MDAYPYSCCEHCACPTGDRLGHDDTCKYGCNDAEMTIADYVREQRQEQTRQVFVKYSFGSEAE